MSNKPGKKILVNSSKLPHDFMGHGRGGGDREEKSEMLKEIPEFGDEYRTTMN
jgi:hypothetical protein